MTQQIRELIALHARLAITPARLGDDANLYQAGMSSHASVNLMLALEEFFAIEFPEQLMRRSTFASVASIRQTIMELKTGNLPSTIAPGVSST